MIQMCSELNFCFECGLCRLVEERVCNPCESTFCLGCEGCKEEADSFYQAQLKMVVFGEI